MAYLRMARLRTSISSKGSVTWAKTMKKIPGGAFSGQVLAEPALTEVTIRRSHKVASSHEIATWRRGIISISHFPT
jgi:hypothetical protein